MINTLDYIISKFKPKMEGRLPVEIFNAPRTVMAKTLAELKFKVGTELGVAEGNHAKMLCENNPGLKLYCVDAWTQYPGYDEYPSVIHKHYLEAKKKLKPFKSVIIKKLSMEAIKNFANGSLDFVYIDGAHDFKNVADDICEWSKKVRIGGIVFGHDYKRWTPGKSWFVNNVKDVVQAYVYSHNINPWFVLKNNMRDKVFGPDNPGWMFVRQKSDFI